MLLILIISRQWSITVRKLEKTDEVQLVQGCIPAIQQAKAIAPSQTNAMSGKLSRMLNAATGDDSNEADRLWRELQPDV
ncbi:MULTISPECIES: hypothetical protein [Aphanizomenon]|uniref:hypothetical protein n=1 Tax=Aphanizomenon TaxID=1175 RepID=UPI000542A55C|nr:MULTISPECIES: hypothetical protein [Aphanizomenon]KHG43186.1 hypothetical protein OA07_00485 [Aphanizomenon flos-aquae 2012/KM1/D3]MTJ30239.1 hypothetical protein [Aphanizomenon sp. UHCC 0183]QSV73368.1 MAG: hypothetical protein HEQ20_24660 [Aphanizomenon flos-aquae KM1D3_PB]